MSTLIPATYEEGIFKPLKPVHLPDHLKVILAVDVSANDLSSLLLARLAESDPSFAFLANPQEDLYTLQDGEPC